MGVKTWNGYRLTEDNRDTVIFSLAVNGDPLDWINPTDSERKEYEEIQKAAKEDKILDIPFH